jgi:hypothetical protein
MVLLLGKGKAPFTYAIRREKCQSIFTYGSTRMMTGMRKNILGRRRNSGYMQRKMDMLSIPKVTNGQRMFLRIIVREPVSTEKGGRN